MKKYLSLIAVLALLVACMIPFASAAGQITLTIGDVVVVVLNASIVQANELTDRGLSLGITVERVVNDGLEF